MMLGRCVPSRRIDAMKQASGLNDRDVADTANSALKFYGQHSLRCGLMRDLPSRL